MKKILFIVGAAFAINTCHVAYGACTGYTQDTNQRHTIDHRVELISAHTDIQIVVTKIDLSNDYLSPKQKLKMSPTIFAKTIATIQAAQLYSETCDYETYISLGNKAKEIAQTLEIDLTEYYPKNNTLTKN